MALTTDLLGTAYNIALAGDGYLNAPSPWFKPQPTDNNASTAQGDTANEATSLTTSQPDTNTTGNGTSPLSTLSTRAKVSKHVMGVLILLYISATCC